VRVRLPTAKEPNTADLTIDDFTSANEPETDTIHRPYLLWVGWLLVLLWLATRQPLVLVPVVACVLFSRLPQFGFRGAIAGVALLGACAVAFSAHLADRRYGPDEWVDFWEERQAALAEDLTMEVDELVTRGDSAVAAMIRVVDRSLPPAAFQDSLAGIRRDAGLEALAVFSADGGLQAWSGRHHGRIPDEVSDSAAAYTYFETPLFSYLYFAGDAPETGARVLGAALMKANLPDPLGSRLDDFAARFEERTGESIRVSTADRAAGDAVYEIGWPDETLLSISVVQPSQTTRHREIVSRLTIAVMLLFAVAWLALASSGGPVVWSLGGLVLAAALLPLDRAFDPVWFDPVAFLVRLPIPLTLGRVLALSVACVPVLSVLCLRSVRPVPPWLGAAMVTPFLPFLIWGMSESASLELVGSGGSNWIVFQIALTLLVALVIGAAFSVHEGEGENVRLLPLLSGLALAAAFGLVASAPTRNGLLVHPLWALAWGLPVFLALVAFRGRWRARSYLFWFVALWIAGTVSLPFAWSVRTQARMALAETELNKLGVEPDPYLEFVLDRFTARVDSLSELGASQVELLYESWKSSGLAEEGSPIHLTLWSPGNIPIHELKIGVSGARPRAVDERLVALRELGRVERVRLRAADAHYLVSVPVSQGRLVTGVVPPRKTVAASSPLGPLLSSAGGGRGFLTLIRPMAGDPPPVAQGIRWSVDDEGLRAEMVVQYPDQPYNVFYTLSTPAPLVMLARATLLLVMALGVLSFVWLLGVVTLSGGLPFPVPVGTFLTSFRARVTWALFLFFLVSNAIFGTLAARTRAGTSERTAKALAERVVGQIFDAYLEEGGEMELLARRVGADLLEYRDGQLVGGSVDDLIALGLYEAWIERDIYDALESRQQLRADRVVSLGNWNYVLAYRRLPDGDIVASPVPLRGGASALRSRDVRDLLAFAFVLGPLLSLGLALLVGRALTRPIQILQVASERVGSGNLAVHLPDDRVDEFGSVFEAFNRMVLRLGDARRELLLTTRRTEAIVEEAATGVIALDRERRVTVANPRAEALLAVSVDEGEEIPADSPVSLELVEWLAVFYASGDREASADFEAGDRRIQVRARRVAREHGVGGAVVILEDVTDELRSERILAWGEMAQQVAHEVKNPLTPIKLSVQHIRRAWIDKREDYGDILELNVGAILGEIDRLAAIATSFSRFGAPGPAGEAELAAVNVSEVVADVLGLYRSGGETNIQVVSELGDSLPLVFSRPDELKEVLVNLLENSRAALSQKGTVTVTVRQVEGPREAVAEEGDDYVVLMSVRDTGAGIAPHLLPRIFEPQFSTRSTGTGLGLAIVKRLVDSWKGDVDVVSEEGKGTTMTVRFKRAS